MLNNMPFWDAKSFGEWRRSDKSDEELYLEMVKAQQYRGWNGNGYNTSAFISWAVALHIDNDQYWYNNVYDIVRKYGKELSYDGVKALESYIETRPLSEILNKNYEMTRDGTKARQSLKEELFMKAWHAIEWREVYEHIAAQIDWEGVDEGDFPDLDVFDDDGRRQGSRY